MTIGDNSSFLMFYFNLNFGGSNMKSFRSLVKTLLIITLVSVFLAGCNTVEGMGEDIERGGQGIQDAAD